jgi:hypothetical protein
VQELALAASLVSQTAIDDPFVKNIYAFVFYNLHELQKVIGSVGTPPPVAPELHLPTAMFPSLFTMSRLKFRLARESARGLSGRKQIGSTFSGSLRAAVM